MNAEKLLQFIKGESASFACTLKSLRSPQLSTVSAMSGSPMPHFVYNRRKFRGYSISLSEHRLNSTKGSGKDCLSIVNSDSHPLEVNKRLIMPQELNETKAVGAAFIPDLLSDGGPPHLKSESMNRYSFRKDSGSDEASKTSTEKIVVDSINDSCSSSRTNVEVVSASVNTELDDASEFSSSGVLMEVVGEGQSEKDSSVSTLKSQEKVPTGVLLGMITTFNGGIDNNSNNNGFRICKMCSRAGSTMKMLICDNCEEAFHVACCDPRVKKIPVDEWFCGSCLKKHKIFKETICRKFSNMIGEMGRTRSVSSMCESNPIASMLKDTEPYKSDVRVGKGFQVDVPEWSVPLNTHADINGEPLAMDPSEFCYLHGMKSNKSSTPGPIGNWLQCKAIVDGAGEGGNRTVCGKWRRAPLFEIQTDNWECFCSVLWDPIHADCAVPQELETDEILKQLKYIQTFLLERFELRPRVAAKRQKNAKMRKMDQVKNGDASDSTKE